VFDHQRLFLPGDSVSDRPDVVAVVEERGPDRVLEQACNAMPAATISPHRPLLGSPSSHDHAAQPWDTHRPEVVRTGCGTRTARDSGRPANSPAT
jgi:hypothetical protein